MEHSDNLGELGAALAKAQAQVKGAKRDSANPFFKSQYADLASVWDACRDALTSNGLSVVQFPGYENGVAMLTTVLLHSSGQWLAGTAGAPIAKQDAQGVGSAITYLRRYALAAVASVSPEDDDGNAASGKSKERGGARQSAKDAGPKEPTVAPSPQPLTEKPAALTKPEPMPWDAKGPNWKGKPLADFESRDLVTLREFCIKKDPAKFAVTVEQIDTVLAGREGE